MSTYSTQLEPLITAAAGTILFWALGRRLTANIRFELGRGSYVGAFPLLGALIGVGLSSNAFTQTSFQAMTVATLLLAITGLLRDCRRLTYFSLVPWCGLIIIASLFLAADAAVSGLFVVSATLWGMLIILCLKIAALVYEMPFILLTTSTLMQFIYFSQHQFTQTAVLVNLALLTSSLSMLLYSASGKRVLTGSSGIFSAGFLLAAVSTLEGSGRLLVFGLFVPSMVILFPFALISGMIVTSYFGNRLHHGNKRERQYSWSLRREKTVLFAGLFFLCLNFLALLVLIDAPGPAYLLLCLLFAASLFVFVGTFARKDVGATPPPLSRIEILGIGIDAVLPSGVITRISEYLTLNSLDSAGEQTPAKNTSSLFHVVTADSLALVRAGEDERFKNSMQRAALVVPDGAGVVWAADFLGTPLPGRVPGVALVSQICEAAGKSGWKIFFIGGRPGIAEQAADRLQKEHSIKVCGIEHGYFTPDSAEEETVLEKIANAHPDIVFVALGVPRQEFFIARLRNCLKRGVAIGVGGSFDVISQTLPRAPYWMQRFGIEWLFRLWLEPRRFMRMLGIPRFVLQILRHKWNSDQKS